MRYYKGNLLKLSGLGIPIDLGLGIPIEAPVAPAYAVGDEQLPDYMGIV